MALQQVLLHTSPEDYGALDFKVVVQPTAVDNIRQIYIKSTHSVFELVPPALNAFLKECYNTLGRPLVDCKSVWKVYCALLSIIQHYVEVPAILESIDANVPDANEKVPLLGSLKDLPFQDTDIEYYMDSVGGGLGFHKSTFSCRYDS
ncbi:hypothetical protein HD554DRAFT_2041432 [Boletus coccyginus]|nr:hypothetical protein HD554DRAFT_2041432 [Boletus coccyginus]